jgi:preprotein translocase subunit YajC
VGRFQSRAATFFGASSLPLGWALARREPPLGRERTHGSPPLADSAKGQHAVLNLTDFAQTSILFAQAEAPAAAPAAPPADGGGGGSPFSLLPGLLMIAVLFYFLMIRPERRKQATHRSLLEGLKKNDRVVTIGGIYGVVTNVQRESDEVTLKVDESTNTKLRVTFGSIARVITDAEPEDKPT